MARKKPAQLQREIDAALATISVLDDWDVLTDALLEHKPEQAADVWRALKQDHGYVRPPSSLIDIMKKKVPSTILGMFQNEVVGSSERPTSWGSEPSIADALPAFYSVKDSGSASKWFKAIEEAGRKNPAFAGFVVEQSAPYEPPSTAKHKILDLDKLGLFYRRYSPYQVPLEVFLRFEEASG